MNTSLHRPHSAQAGVSLVVVLVLLLIMSLLGLAVLRGTLLEERMSANMYDRSLAFQQAESALMEAQDRVRARVQAAGKGWVIGVKCGEDPNNGGASGITDANCVTPADAYTGGNACGGTAAPTDNCWFTAADRLGTGNNSAGAPQYLIQFIGLRNSAIELGLDASANANQYGGSSGVITEAVYRIFARSHDASGERGRAVVVLQANVSVR